MNTCWKCGRQLSESQTECEYGCANKISDEEQKIFAACLERIAKRRRLDWSKVRSTEDVIIVLSTLFGYATVDPESQAAKKLERFLATESKTP